MNAQRTILVIGATGKTGRHIVSGLLERTGHVRALVRDSATALLPPQVLLAEGDLRSPESVGEAADGADAVFLLWPGFSSEGARQVVNAVARRVPHLVYLSAAQLQYGDIGGPRPGVWADVESLIKACGADWTFVRAGGFAANTLGWRDQIRRGNAVQAAFPRAARSLVHERDIADVAVRALTGTGSTGRSFAVTGPAVLSQAEQISIIGDALGRTLQVETRSVIDERRDLAATMGAEFADGAVAHMASLVAFPEQVTSDVEQLTGHPARTFAEWARENAASFR